MKTAKGNNTLFNTNNKRYLKSVTPVNTVKPIMGNVADELQTKTTLLHKPTSERNTASTALWIGLYFPHFAITALQQKHRDTFDDTFDGHPLVIIEEEKGQQLIYAACDIAQDFGVMPGMPLNSAYALCHHLLVQKRDTTSEDRWLRLLADQASEFTPNIVLCTPDSLLLEVTGSLSLFGGLDSLQQLIRHTFEQLDIRQHIILSCAPSAEAALLLAQNGMQQTIFDKQSIKSALNNIAIPDARLNNTLANQLWQCGIHTLRDLWRLPRQDLARRFGITIIDYIDRICAHTSQPQKWYQPARQFHHSLSLSMATDNSERLCLVAEKLLLKAQTFLQSHHAVTEQIIFSLQHETSTKHLVANTQIIVCSQQADNRSERFFPQFKEQINKQTIQHAVCAMSLQIKQLCSYQAISKQLFDQQQRHDQRHQQDWSQLMDLLCARLGQENVYQLYPQTEHTPEKAFCRDAFYENKNSTKRLVATKRSATNKPITISGNNDLPHNGNSHGYGLQRPLWLLKKPFVWQGSISQRNLTKENLTKENFKLASAVERIESGWWSGQDIRRDYYIARTPSGTRLWVYHDLTLPQYHEKWFLHGLFA